MDRRDFLKNLAIITAGLGVGVSLPEIPTASVHPGDSEVLNWDYGDPADLVEQMKRMFELMRRPRQLSPGPDVIFVVPEWWFNEYSELLSLPITAVC